MTGGNAADYRPLYIRVADDLREQIQIGRLREGQDLPSEVTLCAEYQLGKKTVRQALAVLRHEGLITTDQGRPSYVRKPPTRHPVVLQPCDEVTVRPPTWKEREMMDAPGGVAMIEIHRASGGRTDVCRSDQVAPQVGGRP